MAVSAPNPLDRSGVERTGEDRTVHVTIVPESEKDERVEIVRYERAGKWWYESALDRHPLTIAEAVDLAHEHAERQNSVTWRAGVQGGSTFDAMLLKRFRK